MLFLVGFPWASRFSREVLTLRQSSVTSESYPWAGLVSLATNWRRMYQVIQQHLVSHSSTMWMESSIDSATTQPRFQTDND